MSYALGAGSDGSVAVGDFNRHCIDAGQQEEKAADEKLTQLGP